MNDKHPLFGLKVLDFSRVLAGPFAGRMLSDLGAEVVKIEPPDGDITRMWGKDIGGLPGYYFQQNAGKQNISIDLRSEGAKELVLELAREADVVIENYRPAAPIFRFWFKVIARRPLLFDYCWKLPPGCR